MRELGSPRIAIQPDQTLHDNGESQSYSQRWMELCRERGWHADFVDVWSSQFPGVLKEYTAFMWRPGPLHRQRALMRDIARLQELYSDVLMYPSSKTMVTASKLDQTYLAQILEIPMPETWVFRSRAEALAFVETASFPLVLKLDMGNSGRNVAKVADSKNARRMVNLMFDSHVDTIRSRSGELIAPSSLGGFYWTRVIPAVKLVLGYPLDQIFWTQRLETGYFYAQEFLEGNEYDTRIWVIGGRAFAMRRFNRKTDFRASGSGFLDWDPDQIDPEVVKLAFEITQRMGVQSNAMDFVYKDGKPVLLESNLSFTNWAIRDCPGHWSLTSEGELEWHSGGYRAEDAIFDAFEQELTSRFGVS